MLSRLRRRVLGLVIVVPKLAWRACPARLKGDIDEGDEGDVGEMGEMGEGGAGLLVVITRSSASLTPFAGTGEEGVASGVLGCDIIALPSSDSASYKSGGRRSFSISDLRLCDKPTVSTLGRSKEEPETHTRPRSQ